MTDAATEMTEECRALGVALGLVLGHTMLDLGKTPAPNTARMAAETLDLLGRSGWAIIRDEPDHYVTFDADGWFIEHSVACRVAGTIGTCAYNAAIRNTAEAPPEDEWGRWRITNIDEEGLPSLVRGEEGDR